MKITVSKSQWENMGRKAGWIKSANSNNSTHANEAFYCLLAGMPTSEVFQKYQINPAIINNMIGSTFGHDKTLKDLPTLRQKISKTSLPAAYQGLWDKYNKH